MIYQYSEKVILILASALLALIFCVKKLHSLYLSNKWNCQEVLRIKHDYFGIQNARKLFAYRNEGRDLQMQRNLFIDYNTETLRQTLLGKDLIYTCSIENIKAVVNHQFEDFSIGYRHEAFKPLLGDGIFATEGPKWKIAKTVLRPQFTRNQISDLHNLEIHVKNFAARIREFKGEKFDVQDLVLKLTLDASTDFLFNESVGSLTSQDYVSGGYTFEEAFNKVQKYIFARGLLQSLYWIYNPKDFRECLDVIHTFTHSFVEKALKMTSSEIEDKIAKSGGYVFIYELVKITRDPKILHDHLLNIMLAGRNTTSALISSLILELARNPQVYEKLKNEVYLHFGDNENCDLDSINIDTMKKCNYLRHVVNEGLRLYPSVPQNYRCAKKNTTLPTGGGADGSKKVFIEKGQVVFMSFYSLQRSERFYGKDANEFNPDRWESIKNPGGFMPFLSGPRICLGQQFAITEASYIILRFCQLFPNLKSFETEYPPRILANATMKLRDGVFVSCS